MGSAKLIRNCGRSSIHLSLLVFLLVSNSLCASQPLINQLAVLFRARPPWPTTFPSNNNNDNQNDGNFQHEFSQLNELLSGNNPHQNQYHQHMQNMNKVHPEVQHLYPTVVTASSPSLLAGQIPSAPSIQLGSNGQPKAILIAHPVLGPNHLPPNLDSKLNFQSRPIIDNNLMASGFGGSSGGTTGPSGPGGGGPAFYVAEQSHQNHHSGERQNFMQQGQQSQAQHFQNHQMPQKMNHNHNNHNQQFRPPIGIPISGTPPPGGRVIAIPVPSNSPLLYHQNQQGFVIGQHQHQQQQHQNQQQFQPQGQFQQGQRFQNQPQQPPQRQQQASTLITSVPPQINIISTNKFSPSPIDHSSTKGSPSTSTTTKVTTTSPITSSSTSTATTTTTTGTTTTTTIKTTTKPPPPPPTESPSTTTTTFHHSEGPLLPQYNSYNRFTTTQIPRPTAASIPPTSNNIQEVILNSQIKQSFLSSPSTVVGTFRYPDPPTPPNLQSMNTRYELQNQDVIKSQYIPPPPPPQKPSYTTSGSDNIDSSKKGYFEATVSSVSPFASNSIASSGNPSKWKFETDIKSKPSQYEKVRSTDTNFRPSPQLHSFEDSTSGLKEYITVNPLPPSDTTTANSNNRHSKSLFSSSNPKVHFKASEAQDLPTMESGFRPYNHYAFVNGVPGASTSTTTETSVLNLIRNEFMKDYKKTLQAESISNAWSDPDPTTGSSSLVSGARRDRQFGSISPSAFSGSSSKIGIGNSKAFNPTGSGINYGSNYDGRQFVTSSPLVGDQWVGRVVTSSSLNHRSTPTPSSSEVYEDWLAPRRKEEEYSSSTTKVPIYSSKNKNPLECEKFHRFGFCPVTPLYPLEQVEAIGSRCSTLLSHLIAPLPKTDVRYDIIVPKNGSHVKGRSAAPSGWSWKTFAGKPVCDTKEVKIVPGWAKNEQGDWLVILQTPKWQQEAQISLCTSQGSHCDRSKGEKCEPHNQKAKCVQRFTAQRLVVLDPEDQDRCPVVRTVFLPSACVCLNDQDYNHEKHHEKHSHQNGHSGGHHHHSHNHHKKSGHSKKSGSHQKSVGSASTSSGRSLSTSFFNLGEVDLETAADSSTSGEKPSSDKISPESENTSNKNSDRRGNNKNTSSSQEETQGRRDDEDGEVPVISVKNPSNATFMVITEKFSSSGGNSGESSSSDSIESTFGHESEGNPHGSVDNSKSAHSSRNSTSSSSSSSSSSSKTSNSILGSAFIVSQGNDDNNNEDNESSSKPLSTENET